MITSFCTQLGGWNIALKTTNLPNKFPAKVSSRTVLWNSIWWCVTTCVRLQPPAPIHVRMEGPAQLLTLAPVLQDGWECSVKQVGKTLVSNYIMPCMHGLYWNGASTVWYSLLQLLFHRASYIYRNHSKPHYVGQPVSLLGVLKWFDPIQVIPELQEWSRT